MCIDWKEIKLINEFCRDIANSLVYIFTGLKRTQISFLYKKVAKRKSDSELSLGYVN